MVGIPENQLETWSHQGSVAQSADTYESLRGLLADPESPYFGKGYDIFLQGSYGNDTNVFRDSDVDIVICLTDVFISDKSNLNPIASATYEKFYPDSDYSFEQFKAEVYGWLRSKLGSLVTLGGKAIRIAATGGRRSADILVCMEHRYYLPQSDGTDALYVAGIRFKNAKGEWIVNYPKQHSLRCTQKHQTANMKFKPMVRICKNLRNSMVSDGLMGKTIAPSYFIEGLLWNVPTHLFGNSYFETFKKTFNWIVSSNKSSLLCANGIHPLINEGSPVSWNQSDMQEYLDLTIAYWNA